LYFTYWTDGFTQLLGWYIDDIEIPELGFLDDVEGGANGWTVNAGWYITTGVVPNKFEVNFIQTVTVKIFGIEKTLRFIRHMCLNKAQDGWMWLPAFDTMFATFGPSVMVAANQPGYEHNFSTYYEFTAEIIGHPIKGDVNCDGIVNILDASLVSAHWSGPPAGPSGYDAIADINLDGAVGITDASIVSSDWGKSW
jgi:hypothetical protein